MGSLSYPLSGLIYIDANILIYSIERVSPFADMLDGFWLHANAQRIVVTTSELTALESLVGPLKARDQTLEAQFRQALFASSNLTLRPVTLSVIERAAHLRATVPSLKTPDAIHAATALEAHATTLVSNDAVFKQVAGLTVVAPRDLPQP